MWKIFKDKTNLTRKRKLSESESEKEKIIIKESQEIINKIDALMSKGHLIEQVVEEGKSGYKIDRISIVDVGLEYQIKIDNEYLESRRIRYERTKSVYHNESVESAHSHLYKIYTDQEWKNNIELRSKEKRLEDERIKKLKDYLNNS